MPIIKGVVRGACELLALGCTRRKGLVEVMAGRKRGNYSLRLTEEEMDVLRRAAALKGFDGWSAYLRHVGITDARETCLDHGQPQRPPDPGTPTLWHNAQ